MGQELLLELLEDLLLVLLELLVLFLEVLLSVVVLVSWLEMKTNHRRMNQNRNKLKMKRRKRKMRLRMRKNKMMNQPPKKLRRLKMMKHLNRSDPINITFSDEGMVQKTQEKRNQGCQIFNLLYFQIEVCS